MGTATRDIVTIVQRAIAQSEMRMDDEPRSDSYNPVTLTVLWDDATNPDFRMMRAIQAIIDRSSQDVTDKQTVAVLEFLLAKYRE